MDFVANRNLSSPQNQLPYERQMPNGPTVFPTADTHPFEQSQMAMIKLTEAISEMLLYCKNRDKKEEENKDQKRDENQDHYKDNAGILKSVVKLRKEITSKLTTKGLRQEGNKGLKLLNKYIQEVEQTCPFQDPMRVAMVYHTIEPGLLRRLGLDDINILNQLSWAEVKKKLRAYLPMVEPEVAERQLLDMSMTAEDDVEEFASGIMNNYAEMCQILDKAELNTPLKDVLAFTMTRNMCLEVQRSYEDAIKRDPESTIKRLEKAFRDKSYKASVFATTKTKTTSERRKTEFDQAPPQLAYIVTPGQLKTSSRPQASRNPFQISTGVAGSSAGQCRSLAVSDAETVIQKLDKPFQDNICKASSFTISNESETKSEGNQSLLENNPAHNKNDYQDSRDYNDQYRRYDTALRNYQQYKGTRCWYYDQRCCKYGYSCWYKHLDPQRGEEDYVTICPDLVQKDPIMVNLASEDDSQQTAE